MSYYCGLIPPIQSAVFSESLYPAREHIIEHSPVFADPFYPHLRETVIEHPVIEESVEFEGPPYEFCRPLYRGWPHDHYETSLADHGHHCPEVHHYVHEIPTKSCCCCPCRKHECDGRQDDAGNGPNDRVNGRPGRRGTDRDLKCTKTKKIAKKARKAKLARRAEKEKARAISKTNAKAKGAKVSTQAPKQEGKTTLRRKSV